MNKWLNNTKNKQTTQTAITRKTTVVQNHDGVVFLLFIPVLWQAWRGSQRSLPSLKAGWNFHHCRKNAWWQSYLWQETCFKTVVLKQLTELQDGKRQESAILFLEGVGRGDRMLAKETGIFLIKSWNSSFISGVSQENPQGRKLG